MSNDLQKADQIAYRFYTKLIVVVNNARATLETRTQSKVDKWFNLETPDSELFRDQLRIYRSVSTPQPPPPLELQVLLTIPELTNNQVLVYLAPDSSRVRVEPTPRHILLESWVLSFTATLPRSRYSDDRSDVAPSTIYKHGIPLFRSLFTLLRILPAWTLFKRLRRRTGGTNRNGNLSIQLRVGDEADRILGFDTPPASHSPALAHETHVFPSVPHPMGTLSLTAKYLTSPHFQLDELESLLSSRFLSLDEGPEFTPTLKNQQRESISGSPGSLPIRTSLPKSPPSSVVDRFLLPPVSTRTVSLPPATPSSSRNAALPMSRQVSGAVAGSTSGMSVGSSRQESSSAWSKDEGRPVSALAARLRKESTGAGRGADLPSAPSPLPIRRPNINPVHPFKSSTLSSGSPSLHSPSPSLRQPSPLSSVPTRVNQASPSSSRVPPSPIGAGNRPSPPFAPSSLGDRRSLASAEGEEGVPKPMGRKRYSSSWRCMQSASFLSANTDDDDISAFVQDIDARKPLNGQQRLRAQGQGLAHDREQGRMGTERRTRSEAGTGPMLTSESEVDERLRQMNEAFAASLEGLGGGRRRERVNSEPGSLRRELGGMSRPPSGSPAGSDVGLGPGSDEVMGRMSLEDERRSRP